MLLRQFLIGLAVGTLAVPAQQQKAAQSPKMPHRHGNVTAADICGGSKTYDQITAQWRRSKPEWNFQMRAWIELTIEETQFSSYPRIPPRPYRLALAKALSASDFCFWNMLDVGVEVSDAGDIDSFANGEGASRGGGGERLSPEALLRLQSLMGELPDDGHEVPPPTRRVLVTMWRNGLLTVRLYDSANLPDSLIKMIRMTGARVKIATPVLAPDRTWPPEDASRLGLPVPNPPGSNRQAVTDPQLLPQNLKEYLPAPDLAMGIAVTNAGEALIWDQQSHSVISKLAGLGAFEPSPLITPNWEVADTSTNPEIQSIAFSPDRRRVAIFAGPNNVTRLRLSVWDVQTGQKLRDYWPVEWMSYPDGQPVWWNNGQWLIAPYSSQFASSGTGLWDVDSGRFKGVLGIPAECSRHESPVVLGDKLLLRCLPENGLKGELLEWSLDEVRQKLDTTAGETAHTGKTPQ